MLLSALLFLLTLLPASAQVSVNLDVKRRTWMRYEPLFVTVSITNLSGRDLVLQDGSSPWFGFNVFFGNADTVISPRNPDYRLDPFEIKIGETIKRTVNLVDLYPLSEVGYYRVRANIYVAANDKYFTSRTANLDIEDGRTVWSQSVGVPDTLRNAGATHEFRLISAIGGSHNYFYVRVSEPDSGKVMGCYRVAPQLDHAQPDIQFDTTNTMYLMVPIAPKTYSLTEIGVNGEVYGQSTYDAPKGRPYMRRDASGSIEIVGGKRRAAPVAGATPAPKLSDRPPGLPR